MSLRQRRLDILVALGWTALASVSLAKFWARPSALQAGLVLFNLIVMGLFIIRRPATSHGPRSSFWLAAMATVVPIVALRPAEAGVPVVGTVVQNAGLAVMLVSIGFLNKSFGIAPAHRGLVKVGPYRLLRHPLYAGEMLFVVGYCLGYLSIWNVTVGLLVIAAQVGRIRAEERLLSEDEAYGAYQARVPWRLVPGVW